MCVLYNAREETLVLSMLGGGTVVERRRMTRAVNSVNNGCLPPSHPPLYSVPDVNRPRALGEGKKSQQQQYSSGSSSENILRTHVGIFIASTAFEKKRKEKKDHGRRSSRKLS